MARHVELHGEERVVAADARHIDDALPAEALLGFGKGRVGDASLFCSSIVKS
jgi:hypothetical protein